MNRSPRTVRYSPRQRADAGLALRGALPLADEWLDSAQSGSSSGLRCSSQTGRSQKDEQRDRGDAPSLTENSGDYADQHAGKTISQN